MWWLNNLFHLCALSNFNKFNEFHFEEATDTRTTIRSVVRHLYHFCLDLDTLFLFFFFALNYKLLTTFSPSYPFIDQYSDRYFVACYIHLSHAGYCTAFVFNGIDSIFLTTCFHISAQFQIISNCIRNAFRIRENDDNSSPFTVAENRSIRQQLIDAIEKHVFIIEVTDLFTEVYTAIILMHFLSVAVIIGIGSINLLVVNLKNS